jgi:hypothetical protein
MGRKYSVSASKIVAIQPGSDTLRVSELGGHVVHMVRHRRVSHQALRYVPL